MGIAPPSVRDASGIRSIESFSELEEPQAIMNVPRFIRLEVVGEQAAKLGEAAAITFGTKGGRLGRAADNDWVINDPYVSRYQARIAFANGKFCVAADPDSSV